MSAIALLVGIRSMLTASVDAVSPVAGSADEAPVELEAPDLAAQLVPEVYRPLSTALGAEAGSARDR